MPEVVPCGNLPSPSAVLDALLQAIEARSLPATLVRVVRNLRFEAVVKDDSSHLNSFSLPPLSSHT